MNGLAGTGRLARLALRRERAIAPWWFLLLVCLALVMVAYVNRNMGTPELKAAYTQVISRNAFFQGLGGGTVEPDLGVLSRWRSGGFLYVLNGLAALMCVVRHTRAEEDTGRAELLRAGGVGRHAALAAALLVAGGTSLVGGALTALALVANGLEPVGSAAYGAAITAAGWVFAGVAAVAAQLAGNAHTARVIGLSVLGASYLLRYAGDASGQLWMKYLSPIGWSHLVEAYRDDRWWVLAAPISVAVALAALAHGLVGRRDLGAGLLPARPGPAGAPHLRGPVSLSWRLHRGLLAKWVAGIAVFAAAAGGLSTLGHQILNTPGASAARLVEGFGGRAGAPVDSMLWPLILIFGHLVALYPVLMVRRLRVEETSGRAEVVQATPTTRVRWAFGHLVVTSLGTAALLTVTGLVFGGSFAVLVGAPSDVPRILAGTLGTLPAAWLVGAVCVFAYGLLPRAAVAISWAVWVASAVLGRIGGPLYGLWGGTPLEPFHHVPNTVGGAAFTATPALVMLALSTLLVGGGLLALRRRDFG
ncbi:ABC transporter permease [Streptoalloteichus hindustanus]|uniref:ABC-2 type transport system permease protein n=1 Tax=Streptoalloteichus hindustanus TaxID=2017 RepID=A0A1M5EUN0_STRHI|nr:polyketide antibiotic transporter [Streptoalloteichus hindustanus]SHF82781.1 ABC-2 type transport system permease protein [Streptoalloteichus hindustanus]